MAGNMMVLEDEKIPVTRDQVLGVTLESARQHNVVLRVPDRFHVQLPAPNEVPPTSNSSDHAGGLANRHSKMGSQEHVEQFVEDRRRHDQVEAIASERVHDARWRSRRGDQSADKDVGINDRSNARAWYGHVGLRQRRGRSWP